MPRRSSGRWRTPLPGGREARASRWRCSGSFMAVVDTTIVSVALHSIRRDLFLRGGRPVDPQRLRPRVRRPAPPVRPGTSTAGAGSFSRGSPPSASPRSSAGLPPRRGCSSRPASCRARAGRRSCRRATSPAKRTPRRARSREEHRRDATSAFWPSGAVPSKFLVPTPCEPERRWRKKETPVCLPAQTDRASISSWEAAASPVDSVPASGRRPGKRRVSSAWEEFGWPRWFCCIPYWGCGPG